MPAVWPPAMFSVRIWSPDSQKRAENRGWASCDMKHVTLDTNRDIAHHGPMTESLSDRRAAVTRDAIRDAVQEILASEHPASISIPAVAERAGVSVRTVYRYFPNKAALLDDIAEAHMRRADKLTDSREDLFDDPSTYLKVLWNDFASNVESVRVQHASKAGSEIRARRLQMMRDGISTRIDKAFPDASDRDRELFTDLLVAVPSSGMFLELHDRLGMEPELGAELTMWIVGAMQREFEAAGGFGPHVDTSTTTEESP